MSSCFIWMSSTLRIVSLVGEFLTNDLTLIQPCNLAAQLSKHIRYRCMCWVHACIRIRSSLKILHGWIKSSRTVLCHNRLAHTSPDRCVPSLGGIVKSTSSRKIVRTHAPKEKINGRTWQNCKKKITVQVCYKFFSHLLTSIHCLVSYGCFHGCRPKNRINTRSRKTWIANVHITREVNASQKMTL